MAVCVRSSFPILSHLPGAADTCLADSVVEVQAFLVTLVRKFDIFPADHHPQIRVAKFGHMVPLVIGEESEGPQLPLKITAIRNT